MVVIEGNGVAVRGAGWLFKIVIIAAVCASCSPIGSVYNDGKATAHDELWAVPYRVVYDINNLFRRQHDVAVFTSDKAGALQPIPVAKVEIKVAEDPDDPDTAVLVPPDENYPFYTPGRRLVIISYAGLSASYSIEVQNPYGIPDEGEEQEGRSGIIIIWLP